MHGRKNSDYNNDYNLDSLLEFIEQKAKPKIKINNNKTVKNSSKKDNLTQQKSLDKPDEATKEIIIKETISYCQQLLLIPEKDS